MAANATVQNFHDIPGWFPWLDQRMFAHFLGADAVVQKGDVVEVGVYMGKSAAFIADFLKPGETFTVCDLFGKDSDDPANRAENAKSYSTLDRQKFEANYLALHDTLPVIVHDPSSEVTKHVAPASARFIHIDGSHLYEHVVGDIDAARAMAAPDAVISFDDYRSLHTPGVSAAVWSAVGTGELKPICLTEQKLYATFGDPKPHREGVEALVEDSDDLNSAEDVIVGNRVIRLGRRGPKKDKPSTDTLVARIDARTTRIADSNLGGRLDRLGSRLDRIEKSLARLEQQPDLPTRVLRKLRSTTGRG